MRRELIAAAALAVLAACGAPDASAEPSAEASAPQTAAGAAEADVGRVAVAASLSAKAAPAKADALPIKTGFYAYPELSCEQAIGNELAGITITPKYWRDVDGDYDLLPVRKLGANRYRLGEFTIRVVDQDRFIHEDEVREADVELKWCTGTTS